MKNYFKNVLSITLWFIAIIAIIGGFALIVIYTAQWVFVLAAIIFSILVIAAILTFLEGAFFE